MKFQTQQLIKGLPNFVFSCRGIMISEDVHLLSFEKALEELESIVRFLEEGKSSLEEAITSYERGVLLKKHCEKKLQEATLKVDMILKKPDGTLSIDSPSFLEKP